MNIQSNAIAKLMQTHKHQSTQAGFTLLESLVAIIAITFVGVAITPPIFIAVATRFQNQKAEQATYLAQGQVDKVRVVVDRGGAYKANPEAPGMLPAQAPGYTPANIAMYPPPSNQNAQYLDSSNNDCPGIYNGEQIAPSEALRVDVDADCNVDFYIQTFRSQNINSGTGQNTETPDSGLPYPVSFAMGVRVYAANAQFGQLDNPVRQADLKFTSGEGDMRRRPLAILYTQITRSDVPTSYDRFEGVLNQ